LGDPQCPVRQPRHQAIGFWPLEFWHLGPPDSPVVHRTGPVDYPVRLLAPALTSACAGAHCSALNVFCRRPLAWSSRCSAGTPNSPVLHWTVRWIIAERPPRFLKLTSSASISLVHRTLSGGAPDTVRWHTGQSVAPDQGCLRYTLLLCFEPFLLT
jgi:hypothetical protein